MYHNALTYFLASLLLFKYAAGIIKTKIVFFFFNGFTCQIDMHHQNTVCLRKKYGVADCQYFMHVNTQQHDIFRHNTYNIYVYYT